MVVICSIQHNCKIYLITPKKNHTHTQPCIFCCCRYFVIPLQHILCNRTKYKYTIFIYLSFVHSTHCANLLCKTELLCQGRATVAARKCYPFTSNLHHAGQMLGKCYLLPVINTSTDCSQTSQPFCFHLKSEVGRQHQGMDRPGIRKVLEGSGEQGKMEETDCEIICGAPTTLMVRG